MSRRRALAALAVVAVAALAVSLAVLVEPGRPVPGAAPGLDGTVRVGVHDGDSVPEYVRRSRDELARLPSGRPVYALVSLATYLTPHQLAELTRRPGLAVVAVYARVPLTGRQTELVRLTVGTVPDDVVAGMRATAARKQDDAAVEAAKAAADTDHTLAALHRAEAQLAQAEAAAYTQLCACVYALVVRADAGPLTALAGATGVRAVDPAPEVVDPGRSVFVAPLPEQTGLVTPPPDDAAATPAGQAG